MPLTYKERIAAYGGIPIELADYVRSPHPSEFTRTEPFMTTPPTEGGDVNLTAVLRSLGTGPDVNYPAPPSLADFRGAVAANPFGFTDPSAGVDEAKQRQDELMLGLRKMIAESRKGEKFGVRDLVGLLPGILSSVAGLSATDPEDMGQAFDQSSRMFGAFRQDRAARQSSKMAGIKDEADMVKMFSDIIAGQGNRTIEAATGKNLSINRSIEGLDKLQTMHDKAAQFSLDLHKSRIESAKVGIEAGKAKRESWNDALKAKLHKFFADTVDTYRGPDGKVDLNAYFNDLRSVRPDVASLMAAEFKWNQKDSSEEVTKTATEIFKGFERESLSTEGTPTGAVGLPAVGDPSKVVTPGEPGYDEAHNFWWQMAMYYADIRHGGSSVEDPRLKPGFPRPAATPSAEPLPPVQLQQMIEKYGPQGNVRMY